MREKTNSRATRLLRGYLSLVAGSALGFFGRPYPVLSGALVLSSALAVLVLISWRATVVVLPSSRLREIASDERGRLLWEEDYIFGGLSVPGEHFVREGVEYIVLNSTRTGDRIETVARRADGQ